MYYILLKVTVHENCNCPQTGKPLKTELKIHHHYDTQNEGETEWFYIQDPK